MCIRAAATGTTAQARKSSAAFHLTKTAKGDSARPWESQPVHGAWQGACNHRCLPVLVHITATITSIHFNLSPASTASTVPGGSQVGHGPLMQGQACFQECCLSSTQRLMMQHVIVSLRPGFLPNLAPTHPLPGRREPDWRLHIHCCRTARRVPPALHQQGRHTLHTHLRVCRGGP